MKELSNPFLVYGYDSPKYFCDRELEIQDLLEALLNGRNVSLISPRRMGKTGLIHNLFYHLQSERKEWQCIYIDIYATKSLADFVRVLTREVVAKLASPLQRIGSNITNVLRGITLTMDFDPLTNQPQWSIGFQPQEAMQTLDGVFQFLKTIDQPVVIAIDEFQQVTEYAEQNVEALLRTHIQNVHNVRFIFSGSKQHLMSQMFDSPKHPFYSSTQRLHLQAIDEQVYYDFALNHFKHKGLDISQELFHTIYTTVDGVTWYVQSLLNKMYGVYENQVLTEDDFRRCLQMINASREEDYRNLYKLLTPNQAALLKAIAKEQSVKSPTASGFMQKHHLKAVGSVQRALQYLLDNEYIYPAPEGYIIYDRFLAFWLRGIG